MRNLKLLDEGLSLSDVATDHRGMGIDVLVQRYASAVARP
jgi:hypothetical protein